MVIEEKDKTIEKEDKKISLLLEDLASLETYIHDLFTFSPLPICFISPLGVILESNPAFEKISRFGFDEIIGESIENLFEKDAIEELAGDTSKKGAVEGREMKFFPKGRKPVMVQVFTRKRKDEKGKNVGYFLGVFDLTEIKKTESELKEAQTALLNILEDTEEARKEAEEEKSKTLAIVQNFADGILVFDEQNRLVMVNPQTEKIFNLKESKTILQKSISELSQIKALSPLINLLGKEIRQIFREELQIKEELILEISTIPVIREEERLGTLVIVHDVSREKMIERLKTEFVSITAHQLRTPLSAIKWTLRMLLDGDLGAVTEEQKDFIRKTYQSNERMIRLINDLLNITRIEEGRYLFKFVIVDIGEICQSVINSFKEEIRKKEIQLKFRKPKEKLPRIRIDAEKLTLAIGNLVDNAVRYTKPGGMVRVSLTFSKAKKEIEFSVKDTGIGIPRDQQERVFSRFFRAANALRMETQGTGLGLFITKNIIEAHGGRIWFESEEEKGTTFWFVLPVREEFAEFLKEF